MSKKITAQKIGMPKLTEEERIVLAEALDTPAMRLLIEKVLPGRVAQISATCISAAQDEPDLWYYKGMVFEADWLRRYLNKETDKVDEPVDYSNTEGEEAEDAKDDNPNRR